MGIQDGDIMPATNTVQLEVLSNAVSNADHDFMYVFFTMHKTVVVNTIQVYPRYTSASDARYFIGNATKYGDPIYSPFPSTAPRVTSAELFLYPGAGFADSTWSTLDGMPQGGYVLEKNNKYYFGQSVRPGIGGELGGYTGGDSFVNGTDATMSSGEKHTIYSYPDTDPHGYMVKTRFYGIDENGLDWESFG